jgi:DNA modification methylase
VTKPAKPRLEIVERKIETLIPYARNSRTHSDAQVAEIAASIREFGWTTPVLVRADSSIIAGHARVLAARKLGLKVVPCIELGHLTDAQARAYVIADNRLAENAGWDFEVLALEFDELAASGFSLETVGFDVAGQREVRKKANAARNQREHNAAGQSGEDDFGTIPAQPITRLGDVWHIGPHRLACIDSLAKKSLAGLIGGAPIHAIVTDPPYAIYGSATGIASDIADDNMVLPFFEKVLTLAKDHLAWFGHAYICCDWRSWPAIWQACKRIPTMEPKNLLVWDKGGAGLGSNYANTHEMIGFFAKLPKQTAMGHRPAGQRSVHKPNVLRYNRPTGAEREHNAAKPVGLLRELIENSTGPGDNVAEPFCGSGSTMVAAAQLDRVCFAADISPGWCDVTIGRMMRLRSLEARLGDDHGPTFTEITQQRIGDDAKGPDDAVH